MSRPLTFVTMSRLSLLAVLTMTLAFPGRAAAQATEVTTCGQEVTGFATLNADLDCTRFAGDALTIHGGTLTMNGHTITGGVRGVECDRPCNIRGPGAVTASTFVGVNATETSLRMKNVDVTLCAVFGVQVGKTAVVDGPARISGNGAGLRAGAKAKLRNVTITSNQYEAVEVVNNARRGTASVKDSTITDNGSGIVAQQHVEVVDSTVTGNGSFGILVGGPGFGCDGKAIATIKRSTVTGNGTDAECGSTEVCADVGTCQAPPRLKGGATCDHSYVNESGNPGSDWNVCTLD